MGAMKQSFLGASSNRSAADCAAATAPRCSRSLGVAMKRSIHRDSGLPVGLAACTACTCATSTTRGCAATTAGRLAAALAKAAAMARFALACGFFVPPSLEMIQKDI